MEQLVITDVISALSVSDRVGKRFWYESRYAAAFIVTGRGRIRFRYEGGELISDPEHAVYLPEGLAYVNECLLDAESVLLNFRALNAPTEPMLCRPIPFERAQALCERIACAEPSGMAAGCKRLSLLYSAAAELLRTEDAPVCDPMLEQALSYLRLHGGESELRIADAARYCHVSEIWLRKLVARELGVSPHRWLTELRMQRAALLLEEQRPVKEIARCVGYADVFQFSRAYKRRFGCSPTKNTERIKP